MDTNKAFLALATLLALGLHAQQARATQYDPPLTVATLACPAGSTGYGNGRFLVFPFFTHTVPNWRLTIWCNAAGSGRRSHFEPTGGNVFAAWPGVGGAFGVGWPPTPNYTNQYQLLDVDSDGDLDVFRIEETAANTWTVTVSRAQ